MELWRVGAREAYTATTPRPRSPIAHSRCSRPSKIDPERAEPEMAPDCNVAPTKTSPVVIARVPKDTDDEQPQRQLRNLKWGLLPN